MNTKTIAALPSLIALLTASALLAPGHAAEKAGKKAKAEGVDATSQLSAADQKFVKAAAADGMMEVALGEMATEKAAKQEVKDLGAMMVTDHTKANTELMALATAKGVTLPDKLDKAGQAKSDKLSKLGGEAFDKAYVTEMVAAHKKAVSLFENASKSLKDDELKGFAEKTLPTLKTHLEHAQGMSGGGAAKSGHSKSGHAKPADLKPADAQSADATGDAKTGDAASNDAALGDPAKKDE